MFSRKPVPFKPLFLYTDPFVVNNTQANQQTHLFDYLDEQAREDEESIKKLALRFGVTEKLFSVNEHGTLGRSTETNTASWEWFVNWTNFRSLVDLEQYGEVMRVLQFNNAYPVNQVIDLHARLGASFDHRLLNTIVNRLFQSLILVPYDLREDAQTIEWTTIHAETPFLWVVIYLQIALKSQV